MKTYNWLFAALAVFFLLITACGGTQKKNNTAKTDEGDTSEIQPVNTSIFSADSAFAYIADQVAFGPRVPGTEAHTACAGWLEKTMRSFGHDVIVQKAMLTTYNGKKFEAKNIITTINPEAKNRVLLLAHWDSRPVADHDPNPEKRNTPILGADDGASGVGVLMEIARKLSTQPVNYGVDIIFFDLEDYGVTEKEDSWCLGSQYWSKKPHIPNYKADFGILLDMVGSHNATFYWEAYSKTYAPELLMKIWQTASVLGYGHYFKQADGGGITDDHVPVIENLRIPVVNIVNYNPKNPKGFGHYWHTHEDNLNVIDRSTLKAVGNTVMTVLYEYQPQ